MIHRKTERGQALILITLAMIGLIALTGLTVDGGMAFSDRRNAQNAADSAAFAAALAHGRGQNVNSIGLGAALTNGYNNNGTTNIVTVTSQNSPSGVCPAGATNNKDITVEITSVVNTTFANIVGVQQVTNVVTATTRACGTYVAPLFNGNAIVSLAPSGIGFDANGTPDWTIIGGGIFSNSNSNSAVNCNGNSGLTTPSITTVGGVSLGQCSTSIANGIATGGSQVTWASYSSLLPPTPQCTGTATFSNGQWHPQNGTNGTNIGSNVALNGSMNFAPGLYCITNNPGNGHYNGAITGTGVTFYVPNPNFTIKFNGGNNSSMNATAPAAGDYKGVLLYVQPQVVNGTLQNAGAIDLRGNGESNIVGTILAPSADVTMFGNSNSSALINSQIVAYQVDTGGNSDIVLQYNSGNNYQAAQPMSISLLK